MKTAEKALKAALDGLKEKAPVLVLDKAQTSTLIAQASKVDKTKYTEESVKALEEAEAAAKTVLQTAKTQEEVEAAEKALKSST